MKIRKKIEESLRIRYQIERTVYYGEEAEAPDLIFAEYEGKETADGMIKAVKQGNIRYASVFLNGEDAGYQDAVIGEFQRQGLDLIYMKEYVSGRETGLRLDFEKIW